MSSCGTKPDAQFKTLFFVILRGSEIKNLILIAYTQEPFINTQANAS